MSNNTTVTLSQIESHLWESAILANPPYSIKQWDRDAWAQDKRGRNFIGTISGCRT